MGVNKGVLVHETRPGIHVSDGDPSPAGILGGKAPRLFARGWRAFYAQQHGDNVTWEVLPSSAFRHDDDR